MAARIPSAQLDALVWADLCRVLQAPAMLEEALRRAQQGRLDGDECLARRQELRRRRRETQRQLDRLVDASTAAVLTLEELRPRRQALQARLATLQQEEQQLTAQEGREEQLGTLAANMEAFRATLACGLEQASYTTKRAIVELHVDRVVLDASNVEIRYVMPLTGHAQRNGVLRSRHRDALSQDNLRPVLYRVRDTEGPPRRPYCTSYCCMGHAASATAGLVDPR